MNLSFNSHTISTTLKKNMLSYILVFLSFLMVFPAGIFNTNTNIEYVAECLSDVSKNHTLNGDYTAFIVEPKNDEKMPDTKDEFYTLYGSFRESKANYVGTINGDKKHDIICNAFDENINFSFIYVQTAGFSNIKYDGMWKHQYYPLQLMFEGVHRNASNSFSFFYISQSQADTLLEAKHLEKNEQNYLSLLGTTQTVLFDGESFEWEIGNIYLETNYFYEALHETIGDFFLGYNKYPENFKKQSLYFMRDFSYQNRYYLKHIKKTYSKEKFSLYICEHNIKDNFDTAIIPIYSIYDNSLSFISYLLIILSFSILGLSFFFFIKNDYYQHIINVCYVLLFALFPYLLFYLIHSFTKNVFIFSSFSTISFLIMLSVSLIFFASIFMIRYFILRKGGRNE